MQQASMDDDDAVVPSHDMPGWPLLEQLEQRLAAGNYSREVCRQLLHDSQEELKARFLAEESVEVLVRSRAHFIDALLKAMWTRLLTPDLAAGMALFAVGGYGRGELHPYSDVDILILVPDGRVLSPEERAQVEQLITFLWDIGLEVGH
ncbi:MAG: nucleotidyltransferase domain-containing protein, partial [Pseudomonadota bacterium]